MITSRGNDAVAGHDQRAQTRLALAAMVVPLFFAIGFATCIIGTYHKPYPNNITFGVVGPAAQTAHLRATLQRADGSAFDVRQVTTAKQAQHDVRERRLIAAFVPEARPRHSATVIVAQAGGRLAATAAESFARVVTTAQNEQLVVRDVAPLTPGDEIGIGVFMFVIILTIAGYLAVTVLQTAAPALQPGRRYPIILAGSLLTPTVVYLIGGLGFGTYTGSAGTILAFIGVGALYCFVIGLVTRLFQVLLGPPALFVSLAIFVFLSIPSLGATYTSTMLPPFWRFLNHFWLGAETVNVERSLLYFDGHGVASSMLRLLAWTAVVVLLLLVPVARKLKRQRNGATNDDANSLAGRLAASRA